MSQQVQCADCFRWIDPRKLHTCREQIARNKKRAQLTAFICRPCKDANATKSTHPGVQHMAGICDCPCRKD